MLKVKYLFENYELAKYALQDYEYDEDTLDDMLGYFRISSNAIYPYRCEDKICLLRLAPAQEKLYSNVKAEVEFLQYLKEEGYPAMQAIADKNGEYVKEIETAWGKYYVSAVARVPGEMLGDTNLSDEILIRYGAALAQLHVLSRKFEPTVRRWSYTNVLDWIHSVLVSQPEEKMAIAEEKELRTLFSQMERTKENFGLVHYDFELDNVFYHEAEQTCYAIDFDDAMYHFYGVDIEQALDNLSEEFTGEELVHARKCFIEGYETVLPIDEKTKEAMPIFHRFIVLYGYTRILYATAEQLSEEPEWLVQLRSRLATMLNEKREEILRFHNL